MSIESAKAFYSRMTTDQTFRTRLQQAATKEERQQMLQTAGYEFTLADWEAAKAQFQASNADSQLTDADLQAVSGGVILPAYGGVVLPELLDITDKLF